ncbi:MAG: RsmG family class I SAM-dependent methyltransferase [Candidatus Babeliaceae bacterium]|jgi:16S rRNA (guanine527-N7)-methyltransferase
MSIWESFRQAHNLSHEQLNQFKIYYEKIMSVHELFNITAITELSSVIAYHFTDSLMIGSAIDMHALHTIVDVGTGAGFPGIPLKIKYPHLSLVLIEVSQKKIGFLQDVIASLSLDKCETSMDDWRTFLRKTHYDAQLFCSRASLHPDELVRMFKPSCVYKNARLAYWASTHYELGPVEKPFFEKEVSYTIKNKHRKFIFFINK